ncbi:hypothetical protein GQ43DRAFT_471698 [Delitschia confertaspora ATCC 74209]|uniref:Zn(2)-C6 fungal-type domain-containing protein n=1 Tax=Delitschia confertaspora ATCC 74209 TaxID=1513339 RepID=A0A9P4JL94_9PLEO|nr:hypothetical protein GQ43DRAFT_471698 [Delitschia confertaspora ATCC 74209]
MSGYYPPNQHIPSQYYNVNPNGLPNVIIPTVPVPHMMQPDGSISHGLPYLPQYAEPQLQQGYIDHHYEDATGGIGGPQGASQRVRRRSAPGEHVKHRRTRSGCFTCRNRRVKCDETHPICERCRKGNRECIYPEPQSAKSSRSGAKTSSRSSPEGSSPEDHELKEPLSAIPDEDEEAGNESATVSGAPSQREPSDTPSLVNDRSPSPSTESSATITSGAPRPPLSRASSSMQPSKQAASTARAFAELPPDVQFYLNYHKNQLTLHHYAFKSDASNFLKTTFLDMAIKHEPLLYAVVGFAAYYHTLSKPDGQMSNFLRYYNKSVSLLRQSILQSKKHNLATLMTVLQLASIEEMLGDWVNLMGHQKAAYEILTRLYTPQTIMKTELHRKVLQWYIRFDLFVGIQSGGEAVLSHDWFVAMRDAYHDLAAQSPDDFKLKYEARFSSSRLLASEATILFGRKAKGLMGDEDFMKELSLIEEQVNKLAPDIDPTLTDPAGFVTDFTGAPPLDPDDIVNPYEPNLIWSGKQWTSNFLLLDMWGIEFMFKIQLSIAMRKPPDPAMAEKALRTCQMFEAITLWPNSPPGAIIEAQACLAIATLFLPKEPKNIQWCRRMFCKIESAGYIYSIVLRNRMLEAWGLEPSDWWLPNDEGCPPIIRSIKNFIIERNAEPKNHQADDLKEMRGIFSTLTLSDTPSPERAAEESAESAFGGGALASIDETLIYTDDPAFGWNYDQDSYPGPEQYGPGRFAGQ